MAPARRLLSLVTLVAALLLGLAGAAAAQTVSYSASETIPVPASSYAGSGGGDGWAVVLSSTSVYNVFHHDSSLEFACHSQADASPCWTGSDPSNPGVETITDQAGNGFESSGQPGLFLDQTTGKLYVFATRASDSTGGVVCIDTTQAASNTNPFCGFTPLTAAGDSPSPSGISTIGDPVQIGSRWYAFNYVNGAGLGASSTPGVASGSENTVLCFDLTTFSACGSQPFALPGVSTGTVSDGDFPAPAVTGIAGRMIVPITTTDSATGASTDRLACFNPAGASDACSGTWPVQLASGFSYDSNYGAAFPLLDSSGTTTGLCLPAGGYPDPNNPDSTVTDPCWTLNGATTATPSGMDTAIGTNANWNGPAVVVGTRVYVPNFGSQVDCYDYSSSAGCANFPYSPSNLSGLYTVNPDPQRPNCIWINSDNGTGQIQNFDANNPGQGCGEGPVRVLASNLVAPTQACVPFSYSSLQVTQPARNTYQSGTVSFEDSSGNPISGAPTETLDNTGTISLSNLNNLNQNGLPAFVVTLNGAGAPSSVTVNLTWTGTQDQSCVKPGTTVTPITQPPPGPSPSAPAVGGPFNPGTSAVPLTSQSAAFSGLVTPDGLPTTAYFRYGLDSSYGAAADGPTYTSTTPVQQVGSDFSAHPITATVAGLVPNAIYHVQLVASNSAGTTFGPDVTFTTKKDPPPLPPVLGKSFDVKPVSGVVFIRLPVHPARDAGDRLALSKGVGFVPLTEARQLPVGSQIDARRGTLQLVTAGPRAHKLQNGIFGGGLFSMAQDRTGLNKGMTTLSLLEGLFPGAPTYASCKAKAADAAQPLAFPAKVSVLQTLHASAKGRFRTRGRYAAATVRGTGWSITDRCDGTLVAVQRHTVAVTDFVRHVTVLVHQGHHYLARASRRRGG